MQEQIEYGGMTVNERLFAAGLLVEWDKATHARDRNLMIGILSKVGLADQAALISDKILANPRFYGF